MISCSQYLKCLMSNLTIIYLKLARYSTIIFNKVFNKVLTMYLSHGSYSVHVSDNVECCRDKGWVAGSPRTTASQLQLSVYVWPTNTVRRGSLPSRPARPVSGGQSRAGQTAPHHTDCH